MDKYLQNETLPYLKTLASILKRDLLFVDLEATGLVHEHNFSIIEIGIVLITPTHIEEKSALVDPRMPIPPFITKLCGITNEMVRGKKTFKEFNDFFHKRSQTHIFMGFNSKAFDATGICKMSKKYGSYYKFVNQIDIRYLFLRNRNELLQIKSQSGSLTEASDFYKVKISTGSAHRAGYDIALTVLLAEKILATHGIACMAKDIEKLECHIARNSFKNYITKIEKKF